MKHAALQGMNVRVPAFDLAFRDQFASLVAWRRDVRRFRADAVPVDLLERLLDLAQLAPSVGNSQPWRFVSVESAGARGSVRDNYRRCNAEALAAQIGDRASLYAGLKLAGLEEAPVQWAVFCDRATLQGHRLGCLAMPEALDHSVAGMVSTLWLAARAAGLGIGWVSILDPAEVSSALAVSQDWKLIAYLCLGWPQEEHDDPELVRFGWQDRTGAGRVVRVV